MRCHESLPTPVYLNNCYRIIGLTTFLAYNTLFNQYSTSQVVFSFHSLHLPSILPNILTPCFINMLDQFLLLGVLLLIFSLPGMPLPTFSPPSIPSLLPPTSSFSFISLSYSLLKVSLTLSLTLPTPNKICPFPSLVPKELCSPLCLSPHINITSLYLIPSKD